MKLVLVLALCIAAVVAQTEKKDDNPIKMIGCNAENDEICTNSNANHFCHFLGNQALIGTERFKGACVPKTCNADGKCPNVGEPISGVLFGKCQEDGTCQYSLFIAQAA